MASIALALRLIALGGAPPQAHALTTAFTYQGQLQRSGSPANDTCDFQFTLFDAASGGTQVGSTQTLTPVSVADGLFTVPLDFGGSAFNGADRFLQIAVRCPVGGGSYSTLTPRQPLTAAPYALYSPVAGVANDLTCTGCLSSTDLANGAVTTAKIGDGQVSAAKLSAGGSTSGQVLTSNGAGVAWQSPSAAPAAWSLTGNSGTTSSNFLGTTDNQPFEVRVNGDRVLRLEPNANTPNIIGGSASNGVSLATVHGVTIGGGSGNTVTDHFGVVSGGGRNQAGNADTSSSNAVYATVGGGSENMATGPEATIAGGQGNVATDLGSVGGGYRNEASGYIATIAGGTRNNATGSYAAVAGGYGNQATADFAAIAGGGPSDLLNGNTGNQVSDNYGAVGGGGGNIAGNGDADITDAEFATVGGGLNNLASGKNATVSGGAINNATQEDSTVAGGSANTANRARATVGGGSNNYANGDSNTVAGGFENRAIGDFAATVSGGQSNGAAGNHATVAGGNLNIAGSMPSDESATVGGGFGNRATAPFATIGGGGRTNANDETTGNRVTGSYGTVAGGGNNLASGPFATVAGGTRNEASGAYSVAAGRDAHATHAGSVVFSDGTRGGFSAHANDFNVTSTGGVEFWHSPPLAGNLLLHCDLHPDAVGWDCTSDRNVKENFVPVDAGDTLRRVSAMPVTWWNLKDTDPAHKHIGPVAQDFHAAFGLGEETTINTSDAQGVAFAAIQGLYAMMQERDAEIAELKARLAMVEHGAVAPATLAASEAAR